MKIVELKRSKTRNELALGTRVDSSLQILPQSQRTGPATRLTQKGTELKNANLNLAKDIKIQNFSYFAPAAINVQLVGCFTDWQNQPIRLRKGSNGIWWTAVRLGRGTYYYRFLVDGQWRYDPQCPLFVPNPFGSQNAIRQVN
jgi:1,4-alpha-glucan branching enzyme